MTIPTKAVYTVVCTREIPEEDCQAFDEEAGHDGSPDAAITQFVRELQAGYEAAGIAGRFQVVNRTVRTGDNASDDAIAAAHQAQHAVTTVLRAFVDAANTGSLLHRNGPVGPYGPLGQLVLQATKALADAHLADPHPCSCDDNDCTTCYPTLLTGFYDGPGNCGTCDDVEDEHTYGAYCNPNRGLCPCGCGDSGACPKVLPQVKGA